ncbi:MULTISPECIES: SlyX family protein [Thioclava]|uniref:SlyX family protein n=1 Tax=Thioclava TaxID=285107 RepID=UPI00099881AC|nr:MULTISPECIES: SlyX family protein [Thioclava]MAQ36135.1 SlyX protein [Thioclava sp.]OOY05694.1 SlyX protein [Thioclava sp. F28-4]
MQERLERAEEQIAYLTQTVDELSDVAAAQARQIERLERHLGLLMEREAEREYDSGSSIPLADQKPPHW